MKKYTFLLLFPLVWSCFRFDGDTFLRSQMLVSQLETQLPIVNITVDEEEFDNMFENDDDEIEINGRFNLSRDNEVVVDNEAIELEIKGNYSTRFPLKTLGIKFENKYNNSDRSLIDPEVVLPHHSIDKIKAIRLRNSGNDFEKTMLKDLSLTQLAINAGLDLDLGYGEQVLVNINGEFMMGDNSSQHDSEKPAHQVIFEKDFYLCKYPATQGLWKAVMNGDNPSSFKGDNRPVERVSWEDINEKFLPKLNQLTGKNYRLPSETEWEFAARGGKNGNHQLEYARSNHLKEVGWFDNNSHSETKPVGLKMPNELGLFDMSGNFWEWCQDVYHQNYQDAPKDGTPWREGGEQNRRMVRGGSSIITSAVWRTASGTVQTIKTTL